MDHVDAARDLGVSGEDAAARYLEAHGLVVLARNWRLASGDLRGELDLVCRDGDTLAVVEVKTRRSDAFGGPLLAVTPRKQQKIRALAVAFMREARLHARAVRFDVVAVWQAPGALPRVEHVRDAF